MKHIKAAPMCLAFRRICYNEPEISNGTEAAFDNQENKAKNAA